MVMEGSIANKKEPIVGHDKCPDCGSEKRLVADYVAELKELGVLSQEAFPHSCGAWEIPFMDVKRMSLIQVPNPVSVIPTMKILFDVCGDCLKPFVIGVEFGEKAVLNAAAAQQMMAAQQAGGRG